MPHAHAIASRRAKKFFKSLDGVFGLGVMARTGGKPATAECTHFLAHRGLANVDPVLLPHPPTKIRHAPADHAMDRRDRPGLEHLGKDRAVRRLTLRVALAVCDRSGPLGHPH
jgi:hypothetical protein